MSLSRLGSPGNASPARARVKNRGCRRTARRIDCRPWPDTVHAAHRYSAAEMLERLVSFDTTSRNSNLDLIGFVRAYLDAHGVPYRISTDETGDKANIHAIIGPQSPEASRSPAMWTRCRSMDRPGPPTRLCSGQEGGRLYGRGAADMKGFVASALAAVPDLRRHALCRPMHLFITYDEETTCDGARRLIEDLARVGPANRSSASSASRRAWRRSSRTKAACAHACEGTRPRGSFQRPGKGRQRGSTPPPKQSPGSPRRPGGSRPRGRSRRGSIRLTRRSMSEPSRAAPY